MDFQIGLLQLSSLMERVFFLQTHFVGQVLYASVFYWDQWQHPRAKGSGTDVGFGVFWSPMEFHGTWALRLFWWAVEPWANSLIYLKAWFPHLQRNRDTDDFLSRMVMKIRNSIWKVTGTWLSIDDRNHHLTKNCTICYTKCSNQHTHTQSKPPEH